MSPPSIRFPSSSKPTLHLHPEGERRANGEGCCCSCCSFLLVIAAMFRGAGDSKAKGLEVPGVGSRPTGWGGGLMPVPSNPDQSNTFCRPRQSRARHPALSFLAQKLARLAAESHLSTGCHHCTCRTRLGGTGQSTWHT